MLNPIDPFLIEISSPRLDVYCLHPPQLQLLIEDPNALEKALGFAIARDVLTPKVHRAIQMKLKRMEKIPPADYPWFTYWMIRVREMRLGAGLIGFKGIPAGPADVEVGYGIDPSCQNKGYTTEALRRLAIWAFGDPRCTGIFANVLKTNPASSKVLEKAGFTHISTSEDAIFWRLSRPI